MIVRRVTPHASAACAVVLSLAAAACGEVHNPSQPTPDAATPDAASPDAGPPPASPEAIHFIGRFDRADPSAPVFEWSGSAMWTRFSGTTIAVELDGDANDFEAAVDGVVQPVIVHPGGDHTYVLASGLADGEHDLKLTRRTEAFFGGTTFRGFSGAPLIPTQPPERLIEFIGDSITCGYGIIGNGPSCGFSHDTEVETHTFAALASAQFGAAHHAICWSGIGAYRNYNDEAGMVMPQRYGLTLPNEQASPWSFATTPQVVVINLGTNDYSVDVDPGVNYVNAMIDFVKQIRGHYPAVPIVLSTSPMLDGDQHDSQRQALTAVAASDANTTLLDFSAQNPADGLGCDYHPSDATARKMATRLAAKLHDLLGW